MLAALALLSVPADARAQWYGAAFLGGAHTHSARVSIDQPARGRSVTFDDVEFAGESLKSPQYYGWRFGRLLGADRRFGAELEFIHLKAIAKTDRTYPMAGSVAGSAPAPGPMSTIVQRYAMSHGLNFLVINFVSRTPIGEGPLAVVLRSGIGPTLPHAETTIGGEAREQYEYAGLGTQTSAGLEIGIHRFLSAVVDYKFTFARPSITVVDGTARTTSATHHLAVGLAFGRLR
jgi:hypothetical protein